LIGAVDTGGTVIHEGAGWNVQQRGVNAGT